MGHTSTACHDSYLLPLISDGKPRLIQYVPTQSNAHVFVNASAICISGSCCTEIVSWKPLMELFVDISRGQPSSNEDSGQ